MFSQPPCSLDPLVGAGGWHADVGDDNLGTRILNERKELGQVGRPAHEIEVGLAVDDARDALPQESVVLRQNHLDARHAKRTVAHGCFREHPGRKVLARGTGTPGPGGLPPFDGPTGERTLQSGEGRRRGRIVRWQLAAAVAWQATVAAVVGIVIGIPFGIVAGRWLWTLFARQIYAVPYPTVSVLSIVLVAVGTVELANVVAAIPACTAARTPITLVLRSE